MAHLTAWCSGPDSMLLACLCGCPACAAGGDNTLVGIVTFDSSVHFYNVSKGQAVAQMLVMPDVSDVYAPMSSNLLAKLSESREQLAELLSSIPGMFASAQGPESCGAAALEVCIKHIPVHGMLRVMLGADSAVLMLQRPLPVVGACCWSQSKFVGARTKAMSGALTLPRAAAAMPGNASTKS